MNQLRQGYVRGWQLTSTILLSLAITALTWIVSAIGFIILDWSDLVNYADEFSFIFATITSIIVLFSFIFFKWNSRGSSRLYISELVVGVLFIMCGVIYAYYNHTLSKAHVPTGPFSGLEFVIMMFIGIYISCIGVLAALAGFIGLLSNPRIRENNR